MEKIIFFGLIIPIFIFVLYLGSRAIMTGFNAKSLNKSNLENENTTNITNLKTNINDMQTKLYQLLDKSGATVPQNPPNNTGEPPQPLSSGTVAYPNTDTPNLMQGGKRRKKTKKRRSIKKSKKKRKISRKH